MSCRIVILGDFNTSNPTHHALDESIKHAQKRIGRLIDCTWIGTDLFDSKKVFGGDYSGLWIAPGSPYKSMENVIDAIYYTRTRKIPTFGICAGFQHMLIEFARNTCGIEKADHQETSLLSSDFVVSKLSCSLVGREEELTVVDKSSKLFKLLKKEKFLGKYYCNYGLNNRYIEVLKKNGCYITAVSPDREARAFELRPHPFFLGTLFQPTLKSSINAPSPIILDFLESSIDYSERD
jgi:CTP synthase (UTP-ammonia lyase)